MHPLRTEAIDMRRAGTSYSEISRALGINKGTLSYMLRHVVITDEQRRQIDERGAAAAQEALRRTTVTAEQRRAWAKQWAADNPEKAAASIRAAQAASALSYLPAELIVRSRLEQRYKTSFRKEKVGGVHIDFASDRVLIEHSLDNGKGLSEATRRFARVSAAGDTRKRIAFLNLKHFGPTRRRRLVNLMVEIHDVAELGA